MNAQGMYALYTNSTCGMKLQREESLDVNQSPNLQPALSDQIRNPQSAMRNMILIPFPQIENTLVGLSKIAGLDKSYICS
jgi:hypothetical protein